MGELKYSDRYFKNICHYGFQWGVELKLFNYFEQVVIPAQTSRGPWKWRNMKRFGADFGGRPADGQAERL